jgi:outer membrane protein OmpA-like peptidoglycan-associated protein
MRLTVCATAIAVGLTGVAAADDDKAIGDPADDGDAAAAPASAEVKAEVKTGADAAAVLDTTAEPDVAATTYGPGKWEGGFFVGGFITNYFHQFYDPDQMPYPNQPLDAVAPQIGGRFAIFPHKMVGLEIEGSVASANLKDSGEGVRIFGLGGQVMLQVPGRVTPFIGLGASFRGSDSATFGDDGDGMIHAGAGLRFWLSQSVALRLEGRFLRGPSYPHDGDLVTGPDPKISMNASYGEFSVGLSFNGQGGKQVVMVAAEKPVDKDPDKDGVMGMEDECPMEPGPGTDNGCPTKDTDGDGIVDATDKCKTEAETVNKFQDEDGCPDVIPDTDSDGIDDTKDKCKDSAEDKDSFEDEDGCPDDDNDGDGVLDSKDKCPDQKGVIENVGCPDTDGDGDGVVDRLDNCPTEKGTEKNQGCKAKQLVVITKDQLKILDTVKFVTGSAKLSPASNKLLDNIARVLIAHSEIAKVKVEGHTDNVGKPEKNQTLSQDRAESVVKYLTKKGVDAGRLEAVGHGDTKPIEDNKTKKGQAANRRVEFNIVSE